MVARDDYVLRRRLGRIGFSCIIMPDANEEGLAEANQRDTSMLSGTSMLS